MQLQPRSQITRKYSLKTHSYIFWSCDATTGRNYCKLISFSDTEWSNFIIIPEFINLSFHLQLLSCINFLHKRKYQSAFSLTGNKNKSYGWNITYDYCIQHSTVTPPHRREYIWLSAGICSICVYNSFHCLGFLYSKWTAPITSACTLSHLKVDLQRDGENCTLKAPISRNTFQKYPSVTISYAQICIADIWSEVRSIQLHHQKGHTETDSPHFVTKVLY